MAGRSGKAVEKEVLRKLEEIIVDAGVPKGAIEREYQAIPGRRFRFDLAVPHLGLLVEYDGGIFCKGKSGHSSGVGIARDAEKGNLAAINGFLLIRINTQSMKADGQAKYFLTSAIEALMCDDGFGGGDGDIYHAD